MKAIILTCLFTFTIHAQQFISNGNNALKLSELVKSKGLKTDEDKAFYFTSLFHAGKFTEAVKLYPLLKTKSKAVSMLYVRAQISLKEFKLAYATLENLSKAGPDINIDLLKVKCLLETRANEKYAEKILAVILKVEPDNPEALLYDSRIKFAQAKYEEAKFSAKKVLEHSGRNTLLARKAVTTILGIEYKQNLLKKEMKK